MNLNLKMARIKKGYSQKELAELLDVTSKYISKLETSETYPSASLMKKLADTLNSSVQELFFNKV